MIGTTMLLGAIVGLLLPSVPVVYIGVREFRRRKKDDASTLRAAKAYIRLMLHQYEWDTFVFASIALAAIGASLGLVASLLFVGITEVLSP